MSTKVYDEDEAAAVKEEEEREKEKDEATRGGGCRFQNHEKSDFGFVLTVLAPEATPSNVMSSTFFF